MAPPMLNREMVLEAPAQVPDGAGGYTTSWTALGTLWAEVRPGTGREGRGLGGPLSRVPYKITVRAAPVGSDARPAAGQRLREGTRIFAILAVAEADTSGRYLTVHAEEETAR